MNRRAFLGTSAATLIASDLAWAMPAQHKIKTVGLQLYTVRDAMKSDFEGTIARVAQRILIARFHVTSNAAKVAQHLSMNRFTIARLLSCKCPVVFACRRSIRGGGRKADFAPQAIALRS